MGLSDFFRRKPKSALEALQSLPQFRQQKELFDAMNALCEDGVDADEMPNGIGAFGLVPTNPIPCRTLFGSTAYLGRLRACDGTKVLYERAGSTQSPVSPHPIDVYEVSHERGRKLARLYLSPYQKRISAKPPHGFILAENSFALASPESIREESIKSLFETIFPVASEPGDAILELYEMKFGAPQQASDCCVATLRLICLDIDAETSARRVKDIREQDVYFGSIPLPNGPSVISQTFREAALNLRHVIQERLDSIDIDEAMPADFCLLDYSKVSHVWDPIDG